MRPDIKICGLKTPAAVRAVADGGASHAGFIFFPGSPRNLSVEDACKLRSAFVEPLKLVAVTVNADTDFLDAIVEKVQPDLLQLHGSETPEHAFKIKSRYGLSVIKAVAIRSQADIESSAAYAGAADILLYDAKPTRDSRLPGGNGVAFDWSLLDGINPGLPVWLSGGIGIDNIGAALTLVRQNNNALCGLDFSSGVESSPGVKDLVLVNSILSAIQNMEQQESVSAEEPA